MKTHLINALLAAGILVCLVAIGGCGKSATIPAVPDSAPTLAAQLGKDATVLAEAANIDAKVAGSPLAADVKTSTNAQRKAVNDAPAEDIAKLTAKHETLIATLRARIAELEAAVAKLTAKLDDLARARILAALLGLGGLLAIGAIVAGAVFKQVHASLWLGGASLAAFGAARVIGHWLFPFIVGACIVSVVAGIVLHLVFEARERREKAARLAAGDDVIKGVEAARAVLKTPAADLIAAVAAASTTAEALAAIAKLKSAQDAALAEWVTAEDGTQAIVDQRRRALGLL